MNTRKNQGKARYVGVCLWMMLAWVIMLPMNLRGETITATIGKFRYSLNTTDYTAKVLGLASSQISVNNPEIPMIVRYKTNGQEKSFDVTEIGDKAFLNVGSSSLLTGKLTLPVTIERIGEYAFAQCSFTGSLQIPKFTQFIGTSAFCGAGFDGTLTIDCAAEVVPYRCFDECGFRKVEIGNSVKEIGASAFGSDTALVAVSLPDSLIELNGFTKCHYCPLKMDVVKN